MMTYFCVCGSYVKRLIYGIYCPFCKQRIIASESLPSREVTLDEGIVTIQYHEFPFPYDLMSEQDAKEMIESIQNLDYDNAEMMKMLKGRQDFLGNSGVIK